MAKQNELTPSEAGKAVAADYALLYDTVKAKLAAEPATEEMSELMELHLDMAVRMYEAYVSLPEEDFE